MKSKIQVLVVLASLVFLLSSCGKDDDPKADEKSSEKAITSFNFSALTPSVNGTVTESAKTVTATVPNGTIVTALVPTITISENATVSPASGTPQNFTGPVTYTVTAEDGTTQAYVVTVTVSNEVDFTLDEYDGLLELEQDGILIIDGDNFGVAANNKVVLVNEEDENQTVEAIVGLASTNTRLFVKLPEDIALGEWKVKVFIGLQSAFMDEVFTIVPHAPSITSVSATTIIRGEDITITGNYFAASNVVKLTIGSTTTVTLDIVSQNSTTIVATVPDDTNPDDYTLSVTSNGKTSFYNTQQITVELSPTTPVITEIVDTSLALGQTIVIKGTGLKKVGFATNINFMPFLGGTTVVRSGVANAEGTEVTYLIPMDFPTGTYLIAVEVDFEFSEDYGDVVQITP